MRIVAMVVVLCWQGAFVLYAQTPAVDDKPAGQHEVTDSMRTDTLREVLVKPKDGKVTLPLSKSTTMDVKLQSWAERYSPNGLLQRYAPTLHDQIMHPFGFAERKKKRKRKKVQKVLELYDAVDRKDPLQLLLDSVAATMKPYKDE